MKHNIRILLALCIGMLTTVTTAADATLAGVQLSDISISDIATFEEQSKERTHTVLKSE